MDCVVATLPQPTNHAICGRKQFSKMICYIFTTLRGKSTVLYLNQNISYENFVRAIVEKSAQLDTNLELKNENLNAYDNKRKIRKLHGRYMCDEENKIVDGDEENISQIAYIVHEGKVLDENEYHRVLQSQMTSKNVISAPLYISLRLRLRGGIDRQNRVGSKFGGGGVSSAQQSERERRERLKQLALESVDLANDPYLMKNHHGTYECKLCGTLHPTIGYVVICIA